MKKEKKNGITRERVIIVGLICFIIGYAVNGIVGSVRGLSIQQDSAGVESIAGQNSGNHVNISQEEVLLEKVSTNPEDIRSWIDLGNLYFDTDRHDDSIEAYLMALKINPDDTNVLSDLGVMYRRSGKPDNAISAFNKVQSINPNHTMSLFNKGIVQFYDLNLKNEAVETWGKLVSIDPNFKMPTGELVSDFLISIK